jgi:hypothetical protein
MRRLAPGLIAALLPWTTLVSQSAPRMQVGAAVGYSLVGGGDSRTVVGSGVTGAGQAGLHARAFAALPLGLSVLSFQGEVFYNRLTSNANTYASVGSVVARSALVDQSLGLTGSLVASASRTARIAPYFSLGSGLFTSSLGSNPDPRSERVTETSHGMGLGLVVGGGLRWRVGRPTLLLDWRYYQALYNTRGSSFMPLTVGVAF